MSVVIGAQLKFAKNMVDGGVRLTFDTEKLPKTTWADIGGDLERYGALAFYPEKEKFTEEELQEISKVSSSGLGDKKKSNSERLRNTLYLVWKEDNEGYNEFKEYYDYKMDVLINHFRDKLE